MPTPSVKKRLRHWLLWSSGSLLTGYLLLTGSAWWFVKYHRDVSQITYFDIALPSNWGRYQIKRGDYHIHQAQQLLRDGEGRRGFQLLRMGLVRSPGNLEGRILLSELFAANNRNDLATETLINGVSFHRYNREYLTRILRFLIEQEDDLLALSLSNQLLNDPEAPREIIELAALSAAIVHHHQGNYDQAESLLATHQIRESLDGRLLQAQIEWDRGYRELSLMLLRNLSQTYPGSERVYMRLQDALRSESRNAESRRRSILHQIQHPDRAGSQLEQIRSLTAEGNTPAATLAAHQMIENFSLQPSTLLELGDFAATTSNIELAQTLLQHFERHDLPHKNIVRLLLIEALLNAGRYQEVLAEASHLKENNLANDQIAHPAKGLVAIAYYGLGDEGAGAANIATFIAEPQLRPESLLAIADRLVSMDHRVAAKTALAQAAELYPQSQPILTRLLELNLADRDPTEVAGRLQLLLAMRKPSPTLLSDALEWLHGDQFIFLHGRAALISKIEHRLNQN